MNNLFNYSSNNHDYVGISLLNNSVYHLTGWFADKIIHTGDHSLQLPDSFWSSDLSTAFKQSRIDRTLFFLSNLTKFRNTG